MRARKSVAWGCSGFLAALCAALLPQAASALSNAPGSQGELSDGLTAGRTYNPAFALAPGLAPAIGNMWMANPGWGSPDPLPAYHYITEPGAFSEDPASPAFDTSGYDAMWDDMKFSEMSAYGGLERDALRVAGMRAIDGSNGASGAIPYGRLTLQRDFLEGRQQFALGAYGTQASVRQAAISGFGDDSYTDVALDGTWRWIAHPERRFSDVISAHVLVLHEGESLIASHAIFGTNKTDELTAFRGDLSWSWGANIAPAVQYFRITGTSDPIRLGTPDGSPNSNGFITEINYLPSDDARSPLNWFNLRLSLQFIAYSEFDGTSHDAAHNNTVLIHLSADTDPGS
ncbi:MAG TPA: hypothetical protein VHY79_18255 [Rhizomicrobium sp.]|nr:hypothetical protein [Rhizomicrobium sp.]